MEKYIHIAETTNYIYGSKIGVCRTFTVLPLTKNGLDDDTYRKYPALIQEVPRAYSEFTWNDGKVTILTGLPKFTGFNTNQEDELTGEGEENVTDIQTIMDWESKGQLRVEVQKKENGKLTTYMFLKHTIHGITRKYIFGGSKNRHIMVLWDEVETLGNDLHEVMLKCVKETFPNPIFDGKTHLAEFCDGKHIIYAEKTTLVPFAEMKSMIPPQNTHLTDDQLNDLRKIEGIEGFVIVHTNTVSGNVIRIKHKSTEYVLKRVAREVMCKTGDMDIAIARIKKNMKSRSDSFLNLSREELDKWENIIFTFAEWFYKKSGYHPKDISFSSDIGFANIWHDYTLGKCVKKFDQNDVLMYLDALMRHGIDVCLILRGPSGSGKSTFAQELAKKYPASIHETDSYFYDKDGNYKFDAALLSENHARNLTSFKESTAQLAIVSNTNLSYREFETYTSHRVRIVYDMPRISPEELVKRSIHGVPLKKIKEMCDRFTELKPTYYGVFFKNLRNSGCTHLTTSMSRYSNEMGKEYALKVLQIETGFAGKRLKVELPDDLVYENIASPHITLEVFATFRPVSVGTMTPTKIEESTITHLHGVYGAYW